jgi:hypothetical protein
MKIELCLTQAELDSMRWLEDRPESFLYSDFLKHKKRAEAVMRRILRISGRVITARNKSSMPTP